MSKHVTVAKLNDGLPFEVSRDLLNFDTLTRLQDVAAGILQEAASKTSHLWHPEAVARVMNLAEQKALIRQGQMLLCEVLRAQDKSLKGMKAAEVLALLTQEEAEAILVAIGFKDPKKAPDRPEGEEEGEMEESRPPATGAPS